MVKSAFALLEDDPPPTGNVCVTVIDQDNKIVPNVHIEILNLAGVVIAQGNSGSGSYTFLGIMSGIYTLRISKVNYYANSVSILVVGGVMSNVRIQITKVRLLRFVKLFCVNFTKMALPLYG